MKMYRLAPNLAPNYTKLHQIIPVLNYQFFLFRLFIIIFLIIIINMSRKLRIHYYGAIYHVILRGNNRRQIFFSINEYCKFIEFLFDAITKYKCKLHVYCLMPNHVHLLIEVSEAPLANVMQNLSFRYSRWFNFTHSCIGHLFQGRYKAILVKEEAYFLELFRYIHQNPVRAGLVDLPQKYAWSSCKNYLNDISHSESAVTTKRILSIFVSQFKSKSLLLEFMQQKSDNFEFKPTMEISAEGKIIICDSIKKDAAENYVLKNNKDYPFEKIVNMVCELLQIDSAELLLLRKFKAHAQARAIICYLANRYSKINNADISKYFCQDASTISNSITRLEDKMQKNKNLKDVVIEIENKL
jgi:putative transposase